MTHNFEWAIARSLRDVRPREGFAAELILALSHDLHDLSVLTDTAGKSRTRWLVAGAVAGVMSATGAVVWGARRRQHKGVA